MVIAVLVVAAVSGLPLIPLVLVGLVWVSPTLGGVALTALAVMGLVRTRQTTISREGELLDVAAQLRAGRTLRELIGRDRASPAAARLALAGRPMSEVVHARWADDPDVGPLLCQALDLVADHGGPAAPVFEAGARLLIDDAAIRREVRMASAAPLSQGVMVGGAPLVVLLSSVVTGSFAERIAGGGLVAATSLAGAALIGAGVLCTGWLVRRTLR